MEFKDVLKTVEDIGFPCVIPIEEAVRNTKDLLPTDVYNVLNKNKSISFLLESAELGEKVARYSFLGADPDKLISLKNGKFKVNGKTRSTKNPLKELVNLVTRYKTLSRKLPKFFGGIIGYFGYDMVRYFEDIGDTAPDELGQKDAHFMLVKDLIAFDHWRDEIILISNLVLEGPNSIKKEYNACREKIHEMKKLIGKVKKQPKHELATAGNLKYKSNYKRKDFEQVVKIAKEHIYSGDVFQIVLSQRFEAEGQFDPFLVYLALKEINPSPYMYLLDFGTTKIIGSSPEILVKVDGRTVTVRPIAGTRPRGGDIVEDEFLARQMVNDVKERAEHVMLVDLGRNDVGRISEFGSVKVTEFFGIEKYSHVQHIISNVKGDIKEGLTSFDALEASFPAGTVTGAPKVRAMQIIEELEPARRGIYAGSVGYFCFDSNMDFAITIRTIVLENSKAYVQCGAGIVADSMPEREYEETLSKGRGMLKALELAKGE